MLRLHLDYPGAGIRYRTGEAPRTTNSGTLLESDPSGDRAWRSFHCRHFSLVPEALFDPAFREDYLMQLGKPAEVPSGVWSLPEWKSRLVCSLEACAAEEQDRSLPVWRPLLHYARALADEQACPLLWGHYGEGCLYIVALTPQTLQFFNQFEVKEPSDVLYVLLIALRQWNQDPARFPVFLSGAFTTDSPLYQLLEQYLGGLSTLPALGPDLPVLEGLEPHRYPDLRSFAQCVSSAAG